MHILSHFLVLILSRLLPLLGMCLVLLRPIAYAQSDSIQLTPVLVKGFVPQRYMAGMKLQKIDSTSMTQYGFQNLADLLAAKSSLAFRNYGPGQLSTVSFRGTSANHTAVLWNGLNINSPSLGQSDFSTIPVAAIDELSVQYGASASLVGSDAVGGSVLLESKPSVGVNDFRVGHQQASFWNRSTQFQGRYAAKITKNWDFTGKTSLYHTFWPNAYPEQERQNTLLLPTATTQQGLVQDFYLLSKDDQEVSAHIWLTDNKLILVPDDSLGRELTRTKAYRGMVQYGWRGLSARSAWVRDVTDYGKGDFEDLDHSVIDKFANRIEYQQRWSLGMGRYVHWHLGGEYTHYRAQLENYQDPTVTEDRLDAFILSRVQASDRLVLALNLRKAFITQYSPPLTPSVGADYWLMKGTAHQLKVRGNISRSYRVPTLNERYWQDLGNADIRPEAGWNKEVGLEDTHRLGEGQVLSTSLSLYHNRVKDWTYWNPAKRYFVENLQQVLAKGLEISMAWKRDSDDWGMGAAGSWAFTSSVQEKAYDAYSADVVGKQLMYVPKHQLHLNAHVRYQRTQLSWLYQGVSRQYTTFDNSSFLPGYGLVNMVVATSIPMGAMHLDIQAKANNILDTFYLNVRNNAMPGRNYALSLMLGWAAAK
ncbi:iron complex outermembrane receptor protein [Dyadobacter jejuensis]|uniref:Iron complex outermembrane receptor protein n=1 Tax=Dyadobacter jejuensis TaxID=1082580 RepID=A0A316AQM4_9BACT|nr:TonB-dependent receptor [Dyadobacter jejuensis]PWJ60045.1 iron complex outermembrane receptor protein [Dyadobacter jejuensis]